MTHLPLLLLLVASLAQAQSTRILQVPMALQVPDGRLYGTLTLPEQDAPPLTSYDDPACRWPTNSSRAWRASSPCRVRRAHQMTTPYGAHGAPYAQDARRERNNA